MNILIICNDFPPLNSIGGQRPYSWFKYFHEFGIHTTVVTKNWKNCDSSSPINLIKSLPSVNGETEKSSQGIVYRVGHRIILPEWMLLKFGLNKHNTLRKIFTLLYQVGRFLFPIFDKQHVLHKKAEELLKAKKYDYIITTGEPFILFKYGSILSRKYHTKWIADYMDGWSLNHVTNQNLTGINNLLHKYELAFENKYLKQAHLITSVDPLLSKKIGNMHNKKALCVYNGFWNYEGSEQEIKPSKKLILTHTGTLTPGQRVEFLLDVIHELVSDHIINIEDIELRFIGIDYLKDQSDRVKFYKKELSSIITTTLRVDKTIATQYNLESDYLLSFTEKGYDALYTKTYDYIACKKPILVIPNDHSILGELISKNNLGFCFENKTQLKSFLQEKIQQKKSGRIISSTSSIEKIDYFTRYNQAKLFAKYLRSDIKVSS